MVKHGTCALQKGLERASQHGSDETVQWADGWWGRSGTACALGQSTIAKLEEHVKRSEVSLARMGPK